MQNKYELEYNFIVIDSSILDQIRQKFQLTSKKSFTDFYYDTPDRILQKNKYVYRQRMDSEGDVVYTIKGPTEITDDGVPKRLELESQYKWEISSELVKRLPDIIAKKSNTVQVRHTEREEYNYDSFAIFIDKTIFGDNSGASYWSIEIELYDNIDKRLFESIKDDISNRIGVHEWKYSKFQMGEAIKELNITGELDSNDFTKIDRYLSDKK